MDTPLAAMGRCALTYTPLYSVAHGGIAGMHAQNLVAIGLVAFLRDK